MTHTTPALLEPIRSHFARLALPGGLLLCLLLPTLAAAQVPADRAAEYEACGLGQVEIDALEAALAAPPSSGPEDRRGDGLAAILEGCRTMGGGDFAAGAEAFARARVALSGQVPGDDMLWALVESSYAVGVAAAGDPQAAQAPTRKAITIAEAALGHDHEYVAALHLNLAWFLYSVGDVEALGAVCERGVRSADAPELAQLPGWICLNVVGGARFTDARWAEAEGMWARSIEIGTTELGARHHDVGVIRGNLGYARLRQGDYPRALIDLQEARSIAAEAFGADSQNAMQYRPMLAEAHLGAGNLEEGAALYADLLAEWEAAFGRDNAWVAMGLEHLAGAQQRLGLYDEAEANLLEAVSIGEGMGGENVYLASALGRLGELYREIGRLSEAAPLYERAITALEANHGPSHPDVAAALINKANLRRELGDRAGAKVAYERALRIYEASYGEDHPFLATALTNMAGLAQQMGDVEAPRPMLERALGIYEAALGPDHEWVATGLNNLALHHRSQGDLDAAWPLLQRAVAIWEATLGPDHPNAVAGRSNLASVLATAGYYDDALAMYQAEVVAARRRLGDDHPTVALTVFNVAGAHHMMEDLDAAAAGYSEAAAMYSRALGDDHPTLADVRVQLAQVHRARGDDGRAREVMASAFATIQTQVLPLLDVTSERERIALIRSLRGDLDVYLTIFDRPEDTARAYRAQLAWKAIVRNSLARQREALLVTREPALADALLDLASTRRELAAEVFAVPAPGEAEARASHITALTARKEELERELARGSGAFEQQRRLDEITTAQVCRQLGKNEALVDFLRYDRVAPAWSEEDVDSYLAIVLVGGDCARPIRVELGPAADWDLAVTRWRRRVPSQGDLDRRGRELREGLWQPIAQHLRGRQRVWVVPDSGLSGLPFGALPMADGGFVAEHFTLGYLASAGDLLVTHSTAAAGIGALVVGGIDYDEPGETRAPVEAVASRSPPRGTLGEFGYLAATADEAAAVAEQLGGTAGGVERLGGSEATEARLREGLPGRRVVHLATHGFFATEGMGADGLAGDLNPMLLSGVVLAGANGEAFSGGDDGLLTAEEVVSLDLRGTELVTLSACETGLGEVAAGEGVMGLRRAFALAGARTLVISLWKVPDAETKELMTAFYSRVDTMPPVDALREAQLELIGKLRQERGSAHPLFWAAFVVSGR